MSALSYLYACVYTQKAGGVGPESVGVRAAWNAYKASTGSCRRTKNKKTSHN